MGRKKESGVPLVVEETKSLSLAIFRVASLPLNVKGIGSTECAVELFISSKCYGECRLRNIRLDIFEHCIPTGEPTRLMFKYPGWLMDTTATIDWDSAFGHQIDPGYGPIEQLASLIAVRTFSTVSIGASVMNHGRMDYVRPKEVTEYAVYADTELNLCVLQETLMRLELHEPLRLRAVAFSSRLFRKALNLKSIDIEVSYILLVSALESIAQFHFPAERPTKRMKKLVGNVDVNVPRGSESRDLSKIDMCEVGKMLYDIRSDYLHEAIQICDRVIGHEDFGFALGGAYAASSLRPNSRSKPGSKESFTVKTWDRDAVLTWLGLARLTRYLVLDLWDNTTFEKGQLEKTSSSN